MADAQVGRTALHTLFTFPRTTFPITPPNPGTANRSGRRGHDARLGVQCRAPGGSGRGLFVPFLHPLRGATMPRYDAIVLGSGQAGDTLSQKLADHGWSVALV